MFKSCVDMFSNHMWSNHMWLIIYDHHIFVHQKILKSYMFKSYVDIFQIICDQITYEYIYDQSYVCFKFKNIFLKVHPGGVHNFNSCDHNSNVGVRVWLIQTDDRNNLFTCVFNSLKHIVSLYFSTDEDTLFPCIFRQIETPCFLSFSIRFKH